MPGVCTYTSCQVKRERKKKQAILLYHSYAIGYRPKSTMPASESYTPSLDGKDIMGGNAHLIRPISHEPCEARSELPKD